MEQNLPNQSRRVKTPKDTGVPSTLPQACWTLSPSDPDRQTQTDRQLPPWGSRPHPLSSRGLGGGDRAGGCPGGLPGGGEAGAKWAEGGVGLLVEAVQAGNCVALWRGAPGASRAEGRALPVV